MKMMAMATAKVALMIPVTMNIMQKDSLKTMWHSHAWKQV
jgi:hypothetical protein